MRDICSHFDERSGTSLSTKSKVCVIIQLYYKNKVAFDFCIGQAQRLCDDIGITLIALVPAQFHEAYTNSLSCNVEQYSEDLGFNRNLACLLGKIQFDYVILGFDDIFLKRWDAKVLRDLLHNAIENNCTYLRLTRRPPSLGNASKLGACSVKKITFSEAYQASLVYSLIKASVLKNILESYKDPWSIEQYYAMSAHDKAYSTDLALIDWKNILVKSKLDYFECFMLPGSDNLLSESAFDQVYDFKRHIYKLVTKFLCSYFPNLYHFIKR